MTPLIPKITDVGLRALINAQSDGLSARISHIALGDGNGHGYAPAGNETALRRERVRVPIGGGERIAPHELRVEALVDTGPSHWVREVGFVLEDGTLFAVWSDKQTPLAYKTAGVPLALAYYLALQGVPPDSVDITVSGPTVNLTVDGPIIAIATSIVGLQRRAVATEVARLTPIIQQMWS
jgi:hypothetical protein